MPKPTHALAVVALYLVGASAKSCDCDVQRFASLDCSGGVVEETRDLKSTSQCALVSAERSSIFQDNCERMDLFPTPTCLGNAIVKMDIGICYEVLGESYRFECKGLDIVPLALSLGIGVPCYLSSLCVLLFVAIKKARRKPPAMMVTYPSPASPVMAMGQVPVSPPGPLAMYETVEPGHRYAAYAESTFVPTMYASPPMSPGGALSPPGTPHGAATSYAYTGYAGYV